MLKEFKEFISRGSVLDLAVGVIIGGAFSAIVTSLVDNVFMPVIGMIIGGLDFTSLAIQVGDSKLMYGAFIQSVIDFIIIAFVVFLMVKGINRIREIGKKPEEAPVEEAPTTKVCPFCKSEINIEATRCPNCTSEIEVNAE
jgi:large conductance mechanosensitive channel